MAARKRENAFDLPKLDEYFTTQEQRDDAKLKKIHEIPLEEIDEFPDHPFKVLDGLVTNFHLPESTLIMLISAFLGYEKTMHAYEVAVQEKYRFFSFGDAMCILPEKK